MVGVGQPRGARADPRDRPGDVLEPLTRRAMGEGRDLGQRARRRRARRRLRWRHRARAVPPHGPACHTAPRPASGPGGRCSTGSRATIAERAGSDPRESFVARQLGGPRDHVARKVGEEAVEVLLARAGQRRRWSARSPTSGSTRWCCWPATGSIRWRRSPSSRAALDVRLTLGRSSAASRATVASATRPASANSTPTSTRPSRGSRKATRTATPGIRASPRRAAGAPRGCPAPGPARAA